MNEFEFLSFIDISADNLDKRILINSLKLDHRQIGAAFDLSCNETEQIFEEFSSQSFFNASYNWLMVGESFKELLEFFEGKNINIDAEISLCIIDENGKAQIYDIYNPNSRTNGKIISQIKGNWSESGGFKLLTEGSKFDRRSNLHGVDLHGAVVATSRFMQNQTLIEYMESMSKNHKRIMYLQHYQTFLGSKNRLHDAQHRYNYRLFKLLAVQYNFR